MYFVVCWWFLVYGSMVDLYARGSVGLGIRVRCTKGAGVLLRDTSRIMLGGRKPVNQHSAKDKAVRIPLNTK